MIALLASVLGFAGSLFPQLIKLWTDKKDKEHELSLLRIQMEREEKGHQYKLEEIQVETEAATDAKYMDVTQAESEFHALDEVDKSNPWVIAANIFIYFLQSSVRPLLSYFFFGLYAWVKIEQYNITKSIISVWTQDDMALFAAIMAFWFSDWALGKFFRKGK